LAALAAAPVSAAQLAAAGLDRGLAEAERADLVRGGPSGPVPSHPLVGAAAYAACDADDRRRIHARLAAVVEGEHQRARHAALGTAVADPAILAALDRAAAAAAKRGAPVAAAELAALALVLTTHDDESRLARHLAAGEYHFRAGDSAVASEHFRRVLDTADDRVLRARAAIRTAELSWETQPAEVATRHAALACRISAGLPALNAEAEIAHARVLAAVDLELSAAAAGRALAQLDALGDDADTELLAAALVASATADFRIGRGLDRDRFARAAELERRHPPARVADRAEAVLASQLRFTDDIDGAAKVLASVRAAIDREGDESSLPFVLGKLVPIEFWAGRWDDAMRIAHEHLELAERTGQAAQRRHAEYGLTMVASRRGDDATATPIASELAAWARAEGDAWTEMTAENILGFVAYTRREHALAVEHFEIAYGIAESMSLREPGCIRIRADHVESLVALGERKRAETLLDEYEALARAVDRATPLAAVARCRALLAAANGDLTAAVEAANESLRQFGRVRPGTFAFERARTLLVIGQLHRRLRHKRDAGVALAEARDVFERLRSHRFVQFADAELARLGLRPRKPNELTATERRVAELAAQGLTTRQVADAAFLSPKTVEANLTRVYRKIGVKSRAELGGWLAREQAG
jgi:DNA-binding CsgD family transcriptional regulator